MLNSRRSNYNFCLSSNPPTQKKQERPADDIHGESGKTYFIYFGLILLYLLLHHVDVFDPMLVF